ncbi:DUF501 domain-containing protein [Bifidobacterium aquikefiricola]|uniref:DUF501 domain-containing protein n=1 Tax=Bifidobacterium aquikefiricola TaxID=3059038 RepID=A0AB39U3Z5_9BIFI
MNHYDTSLDNDTSQDQGVQHREGATAPSQAGTNADTLDEQLQSRVRTRLNEVLNSPATDAEIKLVERQLTRYPRGMIAVGARCRCGRPLAVVTRPLLQGSIPFPTTFYLTSPEAVKAVSSLEADGTMKQLSEQIEEDQELKEAYEQAHLAYLAFRSQLAELLGDDDGHIRGISAGGMPVRVKCLHALVGQSLCMGSGVNPIGDMALNMVAAAGRFDRNLCRCSIL